MRFALHRLGSLDPVLIADLAGTFLFAVEGALAAIQGGLDLLGIVVVGFVAALGGGILRDVLIDAVPPAAISDQRYPIATIAGSAMAIAMVSGGLQMPQVALVGLDAAGLALFAVAGTQKALGNKIPAAGAIFLGTLTAVGGGVVRDVLLARVPVVLRSDFYASAALLGAIVLLAGRHAGLSRRQAGYLGGVVCFVARMAGVLNHWSLPSLR